MDRKLSRGWRGLVGWRLGCEDMDKVMWKCGEGKWGNNTKR